MIFTELTFAILKYGFLILLWVFVWCAVRSLRRDIEIFSPKKSFSWKKKNRHSSKAVPNRQPMPAQPVITHPPVPPQPMVQQRSANTVERPTLLVIIDGPLAGSSFPLDAAGVTLGRAPSNTVVLNDEFVSSHHARVYFNQTVQSWILEDLGSTNGTMIGHSRVTEPVVLEPRTSVRIGATMFELR